MTERTSFSRSSREASVTMKSSAERTKWTFGFRRTLERYSPLAWKRALQLATAPPAHRARDSRAVGERITPCGVPASVANQVRPSTYIAGAVQLDAADNSAHHGIALGQIGHHS